MDPVAEFAKYHAVCDEYEKAFLKLKSAYDDLPENVRRWFKTPEQVHAQIPVKRSDVRVVDLSGPGTMIPKLQ